MIFKATTHICRFGMMSRDELGEGLVLKPTTMMTNSIEVFASSTDNVIELAIDMCSS